MIAIYYVCNFNMLKYQLFVNFALIFNKLEVLLWGDKKILAEYTIRLPFSLVFVPE